MGRYGKSDTHKQRGLEPARASNRGTGGYQPAMFTDEISSATVATFSTFFRRVSTRPRTRSRARQSSSSASARPRARRRGQARPSRPTGGWCKGLILNLHPSRQDRWKKGTGDGGLDCMLSLPLRPPHSFPALCCLPGSPTRLLSGVCVQWPVAVRRELG